MCRLFAWHSPNPLSTSEALENDKPHLIELSRQHEHGWGMAWCDEHGQVLRHRDEEAAFKAPTVDIAKSTDAIVHLRWATENIPVCIPNTHPFIKSTPLGEMAFIHNGGITRGPLLRSLIDDDIFEDLEGDGDSEQYFGAIITKLRSNGGDLVGTYRDFLAEVSAVEYSSLNAFILTTDHLSVISAYRPEKRPSSQPEDYYDLSWDTDPRNVTSVWSSAVRKRPGQPVENYSLIEIDRATGAVTHHPLR
ncbi:MAG: hypothetical protein CK545_02340 [Actinobacteria bacterium]|nr:MAG: hypothetical protein CK545_02340 [Actinomycetota bacterium]